MAQNERARVVRQPGVRHLNEVDVIDIHTHLHPERLFKAIRRWFAEHSDWNLQHPTSPAEVCDALRKNNVERFAFCSYAHKTEMASDLNEWLLKTAIEIDHYGLPLATVHAGDVDTFRMLDSVMDRGAIGLKIHEDVQRFGLDDKRLTECLKVVGAHNGFVLVHVGPIPWDNNPHGAPNRIEKVVASNPDVKFVIAHLGVPDTMRYLELTNQYPNLYLDTTMALHIAAKSTVNVDAEMLQKHSKRLVFGTDFPNIPYAYDSELKKIQDLVIDPVCREDIFYKNAASLMRLS